MNPMNKVIVLLACILSITSVYAAPIIHSFEIKPVFPDQLQISWDVEDSQGLLRVELYEDGTQVYVEKIPGADTTASSLYQVDDDKTKHTFKIIVVNVDELTTTAEKESSADAKAPVITSSSKIVSNQKTLSFTTDEKSYCKVGFSETQLVEISKTYETSHSISLQFNQGLNRVLVKCVDENKNEMAGFASIEFTYDITPPQKVTNITMDLDGEDKIISWSAPADNTGIKEYKIYNSAQPLFTTEQTYWQVTTEDSTVFISAVDLAGNEGEKADFNIARELLLLENGSVDMKKVTIVPSDEKETAKEPSSISRLAWITFGVLLLIFLGWRIYDYNTDKHGFRRYMKSRRKVRDFSVKRL